MNKRTGAACENMKKKVSKNITLDPKLPNDIVQFNTYYLCKV